MQGPSMERQMLGAAKDSMRHGGYPFSLLTASDFLGQVSDNRDGREHRCS
jgi:hypothetical protein